MNKEWFHIILRTSRTSYILEIIRIFIKAIIRRFCNFFLTNRIILYPDKVRVLCKKCKIHNYKKLKIKNILFYPQNGPKRLKIATGWLSFTKIPNWKTNFSEFEQFVSLHRWNWLLRSLTDEKEPADFTWGLSLVRSWVLTMGFNPKGKTSESYSTGERISNLCIFARSVNGNWDSLPDDLSDFVREMGLDLARRVEYNSGKLNGNHVINNARALMLAGHSTNTPELVSIARCILSDKLKDLISNGFLVEGSSHYQFLFTRWLLELGLVAEEKNDELTANLIFLYLPSLLEACNFFIINNKNKGNFFPTLGDISPDAEPGWLSDIFSSSLLCSKTNSNPKGWARLFPNAPRLKIKFDKKQKDWISFNKEGWYRLNFLSWIAIWHAETSSGETIPSHSHHDFCSLVLFKDGEEVLIDAGRNDYSNNTFSNYGSSAYSHNTLTIDNFSPMLSRGDLLIPNYYRIANCSVTTKFERKKTIIKISHDGFKRLGTGIGIHDRTFEFHKNYLLITDCVDGKGYHKFVTNFHQNIKNAYKVYSGSYDKLPENVDLFYKIIIENKLKMKTTFMISNDKPIGGWRSQSYGILEPALTSSFSCNTNLPVSFTYCIKDLRA